MSHRFLAAYLLFIISFSFISKMGVTIYWGLNQQWIAENLCEKRAIKYNCCKGSCQLAKQLKKTEHTPFSDHSKSTFTDIDSFILILDEQRPQKIDLILQKVIYYCSKSEYSYSHLNSILRPPAC
jgi:hypothetical protein